MSAKELWYGRPSLWNIKTTVIRLVKTIIWCSILFYCTRYLPENSIAVPTIPKVTLPKFLTRLDGDQFYILAFFLMLIIRQVWKLIIHVFSILCTEIRLTEDLLNFRHGILNKFEKGIELYRIKDLSLYEPFLYRILGLQNIHIVAADHTIRFPKLIGIPKSAGLYGLLKQYVEAAREAKGVKEVDYFNR
jgi:hypothetical protein